MSSKLATRVCGRGIKDIVPLYRRLISPCAPTRWMKNLGRGQQSKGDLTAHRTLFVTNSASHGHGAQAIVEGDVQEHKAIKVFTASTKTEQRN